MSTKDVSPRSRNHSPQELIAMLLATGKYTVPEIARQLSVAPSKVYGLRESPLFQALVARYAERFQDAAVESVIVDIAEDAKQNVEFLRHVRDGNFDDDDKRMRARLKASEMLFGRQAHKKEDKQDAPKVIVNIDARRAEHLEAVMAEDGDAIEVDVEELTVDE